VFPLCCRAKDSEILVDVNQTPSARLVQRDHRISNCGTFLAGDPFLVGFQSCELFSRLRVFNSFTFQEPGRLARSVQPKKGIHPAIRHYSNRKAKSTKIIKQVVEIHVQFFPPDLALAGIRCASRECSVEFPQFPDRQTSEFLGDVPATVDRPFLLHHFSKQIVLRLHISNAEFLVQVVHCRRQVLEMIDHERHLDTVTNPTADKLLPDVDRCVETTVTNSVSEVAAMGRSRSAKRNGHGRGFNQVFLLCHDAT